MQGKKNYQEKIFTSFQLSDHVPKDNQYRRLLKLIDFRFLYKATESYYGKEGQDSIDPVVFFKLMLYGYLENIPSDRKIIDTARLRLDILFFVGYDIDEKLPWHSTLSRTRNLYGEEVFLELFQQILQQCIEKGMLSGRRQAVDSMLIKANASMESMVKKEILPEARQYAKQLQANEEKTQTLKPRASKPGKGEKTTNKTHVSPTDPDSRIATKPGKPYDLRFLGQVSVDTGSHIITQAQAFHADKKDSQCLEEVVEQARKNLGNLAVEQVLADTNYSSPSVLKWLERESLEGFIPNIGSYKSQREGFDYQEQEDLYICEKGNLLEFKGLTNKGTSKKYLSRKEDCAPCPLRLQCIGKTHYKKITQSINRPLYENMKGKVNSKRGKRMAKVRQSTVEPVIGTLVNDLNMKKVKSKGIKNANKSIMLAAMAYNLKKLLKHVSAKQEKFIAKALNNPINRVKAYFDERIWSLSTHFCHA